ncbi:glycosyltransferase family protein [Candidatus Gottesmanbacteria bacterium]|nr:glycosyltransferase family protein [Candidatus Gottesmanbacteria bacterium]
MAKYPAIVQIRNGSSRLRNKAMRKILGRPIFYFLIERVHAIPMVSKIIVATTVNASDDELAGYCRHLGLDVFRGSEENVLDRICQCTNLFPDTYFVKFWGDSPLIDPKLCAFLIKEFEQKFQGYDYVSNNHPSTFPEGMQIEIVHREALERIYLSQDLKSEDKEHVTSFIWKNPHHFRIGNIENSSNIHDKYRIVLDYPEDLMQVKKIIEALYPQNPLFGLDDILRFLDTHPAVKALNSNRYETEVQYKKRIFGV